MSDLDFGCGVQANLSSGTRSRTLRVTPISWSNSGSSASTIDTSIRSLAEIHLRHLFGRRRSVEEWILLETEEARGDVGGELPPCRVVLLNSLVVSHSLDGDAVFGS